MQTKVMKQIFICSIITTFLVTYSLPQTMIYAAEQTETMKPDSEKIIKNLEELATSIASIDSYATTIQNEPKPNLTNLNAVSDKLKRNINNHFADAKNNATYWTSSLKPSMNTFLESIGHFNDVFQERHSTLLAALENNDKEKIRAEVERLNDNIVRQSENAERLVKNLTQFRDNVTKDTQRFKNNSNQLEVQAISSSQADIPLLKRKINYYNDVIDNTDYRIAAGSLACASLIGCIWGGIEIDNATSDKRDAEYQIDKLKAKIDGIEKEIATITDIQSKLTNMVQKIDTAIDSIQNLTNYWYLMNSKYQNLLDDVRILNPEELDLLREDMQIVSRSWEQIKQFAKNLAQALK